MGVYRYLRHCCSFAHAMHFIKKILYRLLGLQRYLSVIQKTYLFSYRSSLLKNNNSYQWHYFVKKLIKPDDTVIDIGANLGYFAAAFIPLLNEKGRLYCVEPVAPYRQQLEKITRKKKNVTVFPFALGNENKDSITLGMPAALHHLGYLRHGTVTIHHEGKNKDAYSFESSLRKADEVFATIPVINYIKCDIEGYETVVFPVLRELLVKHRPLVQVETWGEQLPVMLAFFADINFDAYQLQRGKLIPCQQLPKEKLGSSDILFISKDKTDTIAEWIAG